MLDKKNLSRNVYEYFSECYMHSRLKSVLLITNKQSLFYSQYDPNDHMIHLPKFIDVFNATHKETMSWDSLDYRDNVYIASEGKKLYLFLPNNKAFTFFQYQFLLDFLKLVEDFEKDFQRNVDIVMVNGKTYHSIVKFKAEIKHMLTTNIDLEEEYILGNTLCFEQIKESILYTTSLLKCQSMDEFLCALEKSTIFYKDPFYHDYFCKLFPDFLELKDCFYYLNNTGVYIDSQFFQTISLDCLKEQLNAYMIQDNLKLSLL